MFLACWNESSTVDKIGTAFVAPRHSLLFMCTLSYITYDKLLSSVGYIFLRLALVSSPLGQVDPYYTLPK